ncbi:hypothetical protein O181_053430 [Austropuccinia psidii MF-1]|uniref:Uncharacterized protein n=1 Tax=Austropuccinia psidii MF-1 TaxID=1389203 RepID=A0A9Q3HTH9_9BASI|nr:hypothetical protein [Austropuccinia psidii MF-1]
MKLKNPPDKEAHANEAPKGVSLMKDVLYQVKELSEAVNPPKKAWKDELNTQGYPAEDMEKRIVSRRVINFLYPNFQRVHSEGTKSPKDLVREFDKEKMEISQKIIENPVSRPEDTKIVEPKKEEKEFSIASVEDWCNWEAPTVSLPTEMLETHVTLNQKTQRLAKQEIQNKDSRSKYSILPRSYHEDEA